MEVQYNEVLARSYLEQMRGGNENIFSLLYDVTHVMVYRTAALLIKRKEDVADVVQEIYVQLFSHHHKYDSSRPFKNWLLGIVYKQVASYKRKQWLSFRLQDRVRKNHEIVTSTIDLSDRYQLEQWLYALPYKKSQIIVLKYYHDLSQEEIAQILMIPVGTVKSRLSSALKSLRQEYAQLFSLETLRSVK